MLQKASDFSGGNANELNLDRGNVNNNNLNNNNGAFPAISFK